MEAKMPVGLECVGYTRVSDRGSKLKDITLKFQGIRSKNANKESLSMDNSLLYDRIPRKYVNLWH